MLREHINQHCVEDDYVLYMMGKTAQCGHLNVQANLISNFLIKQLKKVCRGQFEILTKSLNL